MIAAIVMALAGTVSGCGEPLALPSAVAAADFIVVGELHGTNESPTFTGRIVCALSEDKPVALALEFNADLQDAFDDYVSSDGGVEARAR
jgi:uncharacterized iron-regulated protein